MDIAGGLKKEDGEENIMSASPRFMLLHCCSDHLSSSFLQKVSPDSAFIFRICSLSLSCLWKLPMLDAPLAFDHAPAAALVCFTIVQFAYNVTCLRIFKSGLTIASVMTQARKGWQSVCMASGANCLRT